MEFLDKMNIGTSLSTYDELLKTVDSTEETSDTSINKDNNQNNNQNSSLISTYNLDEEVTTSTETDETSISNNDNTDQISEEKSKKYTAIIKTLADRLGYDFDESTFEDNVENFFDSIEQIIEDKGYSLYEKEKEEFLTPMQKRFIDMVEQGVDEKEAIDFFKEYKKIDTLTEESLEDNKTAKELYRAYLKKTTKFSDTKIEKEITEEEELGSLTEKAKESLSELKDIYKSEELEKKKIAIEKEKLDQENLKQNIQRLNDYLENTEEIAGIKLTKKMKEDWKKEYSNIPHNGKPANPIALTREQDPNKFDALLKFYHSLGLFKFDKRVNDFRPDLKVLNTLSKKDVFKQVEDAINAEHSKRIASSGKSLEDMNFDNSKEDQIKKLIEISKKSQF